MKTKKWTPYINNLYKPFLCLLCLLVHYTNSNAQSFNAYAGSYISVSDTLQLVNGKTYPNGIQIQVQGGSQSIPNWKLTIQPLTAYFVPSQNSDAFGAVPNWPIKYFGLQYNSSNSTNSWSNSNSLNLMGPTTALMPFSGSEITLIQRSAYTMVSGDYFALGYDFVLIGNRQMLLLHNGTYNVVLRFRLYNQSNTVVTQTDINYALNVQVQPYGTIPVNVPQYSNQIILQNGASNVGLSFSTNDAFANGVETSFTDGLKISSVDGRYEIKVQSSSDYFTYSGALTTIPTNKIQIVPSQGSTSITSSTYTPVNMNATQQTLITNLGNQGTANNYNLKFTTKQNANQSAFTGIQSGVYATQVSFIMNPL